MKTAPQPHSINGSRLHASLRLWGRREPPLYYDVTHACENQPHACCPRHTHLPTPHHTRESWEAQRAKNLTAVKTAPPARALFWAWRNSARHRVWPRPGGSCRCTKRGVHFLYPYNYAWAVRAAPTTTPSEAREVSQGKTEARGNWSNAKARTTKSQGTRRAPPVRSLPGPALAAPARPLPRQLAPRLRSKSPLSPLPPWGKDSGDVSVVACRSL